MQHEHSVGATNFQIALTFLIGLVLTILPLSHWLALIWPQWVVLITIYWIIKLPHRIGIGTAWLAGLLLDVMANNFLGDQALALIIVAYITLNLQQRIRLYPPLQQMLCVLALVASFEFTRFWIHGMLSMSVQIWFYIATTISSGLVWPILTSAMRHIKDK